MSAWPKCGACAAVVVCRADCTPGNRKPDCAARRRGELPWRSRGVLACGGMSRGRRTSRPCGGHGSCFSPGRTQNPVVKWACAVHAASGCLRPSQSNVPRRGAPVAAAGAPRAGSAASRAARRRMLASPRAAPRNLHRAATCAGSCHGCAGASAPSACSRWAPAGVGTARQPRGRLSVARATARRGRQRRGAVLRLPQPVARPPPRSAGTALVSRDAAKSVDASARPLARVAVPPPGPAPPRPRAARRHGSHCPAPPTRGAPARPRQQPPPPPPQYPLAPPCPAPKRRRPDFARARRAAPRAPPAGLRPGAH